MLALYKIFDMYILLVLVLMIAGSLDSVAQESIVTGHVGSRGVPLAYATVKAGTIAVMSDSSGFFLFKNLSPGRHNLKASALGFGPLVKTIELGQGDTVTVDFDLSAGAASLNEVVVSGTLKEVSRLESPVPVEVYTPSFFRKNPTPSIFDALQNVNGVRPQINCNVCNTGDIHINGLEGPYTMVMIDGMPIVSSLSTVYGLSGIPNSLVERIEIVKGPASSLYGSEAVGGLINIITKKPSAAPVFSADVFSTSWNELNADLSFKLKHRNLDMLNGINYYNYQNPEDRNSDNFTDVTLQHRVSAFQKLSLRRKANRQMSLAGRYFYEDRWGGELNWNRSFRGGSSVYGESIYTKRWELLGSYELPVKERMLFSFSYNDHDQNSVYGSTTFLARQKIAFSQLTIDKKVKKHDLLAGTAVRYTLYNDNTPATGTNYDQPDKVWLPGIFVQDDISLHARHNLLLGMRYDYHSSHGNILTPRFAYRYKINDNNILRLNAGTGFRVVNLFTEDHAALTGARTVEVLENLKPEKSYNVNLNFIKKIVSAGYSSWTIDMSGWYTYFTNRITADYETDANKIIYDNLDGHAVSRGLSANLDYTSPSSVKLLAGLTLMDVYTAGRTNDLLVKERQMLTERWMGTWAFTLPFKKLNLNVDYTGNIYGPMRLPLLGAMDPRKGTSPVWSIQNVQLTYSIKKYEIYGGIKNLLNWTPAKGNPFIIARSDDPFDKNVEFDGGGNVKATALNPYALTFDPAYVFAPNQGIRGFLGVRVSIRK